MLKTKFDAGEYTFRGKLYLFDKGGQIIIDKIRLGIVFTTKIPSVTGKNILPYVLARMNPIMELILHANYIDEFYPSRPPTLDLKKSNSRNEIIIGYYHQTGDHEDKPNLYYDAYYPD